MVVSPRPARGEKANIAHLQLTRTLGYPKFAQRMARHETNAPTLVAQYQALTYLLMPSHIPRVVPRDADDDHVIACAVAA